MSSKKGKQVRAIVPTPAPDSREKARAQFKIRTGREIPPIVHESIYPWGELAESLKKNGPEGELPSFFVTFDTREEAESKRSSIQASGRNYYVKRRMKLSVISRVVEEEGIFGVESWAIPAAE